MPEAAILPLPAAPTGTRWVPIDALKSGDRILDISDVFSDGLSATTMEATVLEKAPMDELRARAGSDRGAAQDQACWVAWQNGEGIYAHAVHLVGSEDAERMAERTGLPRMLLLGVVRLALTRA